jgi:hypothetical protein
MVLITPKYLTTELAKKAVYTARLGVFGLGVSAWGEIPVNRRTFHVVILVPVKKHTKGIYKIEPHVLHRETYRGGVGSSVSTPAPWTGPYDEIAYDKAIQRWHDQSDGSAMVTPHLLFPGNTKYWGAVKREGIVAACSGVQPEFDRLIASITVDALIALALHAFKNDPEREGKDFLL